ncbi:hypothetical protein POM88_010586 [Heracleum sosnowskyi]|uniref:Uncharacterized protein n=1 Tax=Heracleum sosnowskyi TaxID=360622 RepID=A0AAD8MVV9_9APIA|nr:hypothetical protein POM88_010586 [Heracleum sosnowskyi]
MGEKQSDETSKVSIYIHVVDPRVGQKHKVVSMLYKIEMDRDLYKNPTPLARILHPNNPNIKLDLPLIKPVYIFNRQDKFYPSGMSFVNLGSKLYFMGGSVSYKSHLLGLSFYNSQLDDKYFDGNNHPVCNAFEDFLECFPPNVYVFDCITSQLLDCGIPSMKTGKPEDPITFVLDDQIFVLSSRNGPKGMTHFETFNPLSNKWKEWKTLKTPGADFFSEKKTALGSALMGRKLFVTYHFWDDFHILWYDIDTDYWTHCKSSHLPQIYRDSVFVDNVLYSTVGEPLQYTPQKYVYPVLSFDGFDSTNNTMESFTQSDVLKKYNRICPSDLANWPIYVNQLGYSTRSLLHLGGFLNGTNNNSSCLGLVELFKSYGQPSECGGEYQTQCELRFVVFEALQGNSSNGGSSNGRTIHACHFSSDLSAICLLNSACVTSSSL